MDLVKCINCDFVGTIKTDVKEETTKPNYKEQILHVNSDIELNLRMIKE